MIWKRKRMRPLGLLKPQKPSPVRLHSPKELEMARAGGRRGGSGRCLSYKRRRE